VAESVNVEVAHKLAEHEEHDGHGGGRGDEHSRWHRVLDVFEVMLLAVVAVATAWTGYQAAQWDGRQSLRYGESSRLRFEADAASTRAGQEIVADSAGFTAWQQAHSAGDTELMDDLVRRFTPDYRAAFDEWLATDPFQNPDAPAGPAYMPGYVNADSQKATALNKEASDAFEEGSEAREHGEEYVRNAVLFASVLFLVALAQRQRSRGARLAANGIAFALFTFVMVSVVTLPRL
jgi:hypothetical protein